MQSSADLLTPDLLREHQRWMEEKIYEQPYLLLASYMGSGKTVSVLTAARRLLDEFMVRRILIVAPLLVAETTWPDEIEGWSHTRPISYEVITGPEERRLARLAEPAEIHIINRENVPWLWRRLGKDWPYDWVVWDESSRLKAGRKRTGGGKKLKADGSVTKPQLSEFGAICAARKRIAMVTELTGTPAPNGIQDLWGQIYLLDQGERLGRSKTAFLRRWFDSDYMGYKYTPRPHAESEIMDRIKDIMVCLKEEDYADLPPLVPNIVKAPLPKKAMEEYRRFELTLVSEEYDVEAVSRGVLTNKLLQFANGSLYNEDRDALPVHEAKLDALQRIVDEAAGQPLLVAYSFKFDLQRILKRFPKAVILAEDPDAVKKWNRGEIPMLLAHPASAGHGLNLQKGGNIAVWYGLTWSLELYQQFNKRLHRGDQTRTVFLHHIVAPGTADEDVLEAMNTKGATQDTVTDAVRVRLRRGKR